VQDPSLSMKKEVTPWKSAHLKSTLTGAIKRKMLLARRERRDLYLDYTRAGKKERYKATLSCEGKDARLSAAWGVG